MTEEAFVFSNQGSLNEVRRNLSERNRFVAEVVRARHVVEDETIAIRDDYRLGGLGSELRRKLEGERKKAPARYCQDRNNYEPAPPASRHDAIDPSLEFRHDRGSSALAVGSFEGVRSDEPAARREGKELWLIHRLDFGGGRECRACRRDTGLVGKSVASRTGEIVHKEENSIVSEFLMRDAPVLLALQSPGLTGKISIYGLKDGGQGIIHDKVTSAVPGHRDLKLHLDEVSRFRLAECFPLSAGQNPKVTTGNLQAVGGHWLLWGQIRFRGELDAGKSPGRSCGSGH